MRSLYGSDVLEVAYGEKRLHFDPVEHRYWLGEMELTSVTRYLKDAGYCHPFHGDGSAALFGRYVHEATAYADADDLDIDTLDPLIAARLRAWMKFKEVEGFAPDMALRERPCFHPIYLYGGTPDAPGRRKDKPCVVEIKSGTPEPWHQVQVGGAYAPMLAQHYPQYHKAESMLVYLKDDETYDVVVADDKQLPALFLSITACVNGRSRYGDKNGRTGIGVASPRAGG